MFEWDSFAGNVKETSFNVISYISSGSGLTIANQITTVEPKNVLRFFAATTISLNHERW